MHRSAACIVHAGYTWLCRAPLCAVLLAAGAHMAPAGTNVWTSHGPYGGDVRVLAVDPATPSTLYAGTYDSGVFKSTDAGSTWRAVNHGLTSTRVRALAIDPRTPTSVYAATDTGVFDIEPVVSTATDSPTPTATPTQPSTPTWTPPPTRTPTPKALPSQTPTPTFTQTPTWTLPPIGTPTGAPTWTAMNSPARTPTQSQTSTPTPGAVDTPTIPSTPAPTTPPTPAPTRQPTAVVGTGTAASCTEAALDAALASGVLVTFDCGPAPVTITLTQQKDISLNTTVDGGGLITLDGNYAVRAFSVAQGIALSVENLTIINGSSGQGAAIYSSGTLTVTNCTFAGNSASGAGASGGAIYNGGGALAVRNSTFAGNSVAVTAVRLPALSACGFGPIGGFGGAIDNLGTLSVSNSTFSGNYAAVNGDAIYNGGTLTVINSTFAGNSGSGGAILNAGTCSAGSCTTILTNTIVANSSPGSNCSGSITDRGHNLDDGTTCGFMANGSLSNTNPQFDPAGLRDNGGPTQTIALCTEVHVPAGCVAASPAINAGNDAYCVSTPVRDLDQRGFLRPGTGHTHCSIGAYEAAALPPAPTLTPPRAPTFTATPTQAPTRTPTNTPTETMTATPTVTPTATPTATSTTTANPVSCAGDCDNSGQVTIDELLILVNIALGSAPASACPHGIPSGTPVDLPLILRAVNHIMNGCG